VRALLPILVTGLLLAAGCGGSGDEEPTPQERLEEAVEGHEKAVNDQDCEAFARYAHSAVRPPGRGPDDPPDAQECRNLGNSYTRLLGFRPRRSKVFGSAAIVEGGIEGRSLVLIWTLDEGRWTQVQAAPAIGGQLDAPDRAENTFAQNAEAFVDAQRKGDCPRVFRLLNAGSPFVEQAQGDERAFCKRYRESRRAPDRLSTQLAAAPAAKPEDLGGTKDFRFFGLDTGRGRRWTLILSTHPPELPPGNHATDSVLDYYPNTR
jgi:hypothetical protein